MIGMDKATGQQLEGNAHLAQSIGDILSTPLGTRVMRRDYGSMLFDLIDQPINPATRLLLHAATAIALQRWEPRLRLKRVLIGLGERPGEMVVAIEGERTDIGQANTRVQLSIPIRRGGASPSAG
jgi:hypothetical protein